MLGLPRRITPGALEPLNLFPLGPVDPQQLPGREGGQARTQARELLLQTDRVGLWWEPSRCPAWAVAPPSPLRMLMAPPHLEEHFKFQAKQTSLDSCLWQPHPGYRITLSLGSALCRALW